MLAVAWFASLTMRVPPRPGVECQRPERPAVLTVLRADTTVRGYTGNNMCRFVSKDKNRTRNSIPSTLVEDMTDRII
jgi:hypothetical protein